MPHHFEDGDSVDSQHGYVTSDSRPITKGHKKIFAIPEKMRWTY